jgi:hypothetical protein
MRYIFLSLIFSLSLFQGVKKENNGRQAPGQKPDSVIIKKCQDFEITGYGTSDQWKNTEWINLPQEAGNISPHKTMTKVLYSQKGIYFLYNCEDSKLTSSMKADNLNLWEGDVVEAFLWPDESFPVYFEYELSPFNFELPIIVPNKNGNFLGWLPWHYDGSRKTRHAVSVSRVQTQIENQITAWTAEFFIPFDLLTPLIAGPPVSGDRWRANLYRIDYDNGIVPYSWQKTEKTFHEYKKFGIFKFE